MTPVAIGSKKKVYKSIREAAAAAGMSYITFYMRLRAGDRVYTAMKKPVRKYNRKQGIAA